MRAARSAGALAEQAAEEVEIFEHRQRRIQIAAEALRHIGDARRASGAVRASRMSPPSARTSPD